MDTKIYSTDGKEKGVLKLSDEVFAREVSEGSVYHAIKNELANLRVGTACTKTRAEVKGTSAKPWRQKGTGRARAGRRRSPVWVGGGIVFGPRPRDYSYSLPRKMKQLAMKSILTMKASAGVIKIVEDFSVKSGKTKELNTILKGLVSREGRTILITTGDDEMLKRAGRNIPWLSFLSYNRLRAHDLFYSKNIIMFKGAAENLGAFYGSKEAGEK